MYVSRESGLTANHATGTYLCRSGHTNLRGHDGVAAHFTVVGYLYEIVEFHTLVYTGATHSCAVDRSVGAYLNIVVNLDIANLRYLVVNPVDRSKSEAVGSYHNSTVQYTVTAYLATVVHLDSGIQDCVVAYDRVVAHIALGIYLNSFSYRNTLSYI